MEQKTFIGKEGLDAIWRMVDAQNPRSVMVVTSMDFYALCGAQAIIDKALAGRNVTMFTDFRENPKWEDVEKGLSVAHASQVELFIAVGGGSVLDMAKLIRFFHSYDGDPRGRVFTQTKQLVPLVALPTTSGTGAEATHFAVCYVDGTKYSVEHDDVLPDYVALYPAFTYGNPRYLTACTAFDALAQSIEAYWSVGATDESDGYALKALGLIWPNIDTVVNHPTEQSRDAMAEGAYWAGRAINIAKTTAPHAFSYQFTSHCYYPHGHAVSLTFPFFLALNLNAKKEALQPVVDFSTYCQKMQHLRESLKIECGDEAMVFRGLIESIGLGTKGFGDSNLRQLIDGVNVQRLNNNPVVVDNATVSDLYAYLQQMK